MSPDLGPDKSACRWYFRPVSIIVAIFAIGPFAIPLVWMSPALRRWHKIAATLFIALLTIWAVNFSVDLLKIALKEMQGLQEALR